MIPSELHELESSTLLAQTGLLVAASDREGRISLLSPGMQDLFDLPFERMTEDELSDRFRLYTHDGSAPLATEDVPLVRARRGETVRDELITTRTEAGCLVYLRCNASPLVDRLGRPNGAIVLVQDVTAERAALERQAELRERLLATVNHHFRTPVTNLLGYAEVLDDQRQAIPPESHRAVDAVLRAAKQLGALLETVSALVDLDRHTELTRTSGDLAVALRQAARTLQPIFDAQAVGLRVDLPPRLPAVIDFAEVRRAVSELLKNAATYAPAGSTVELRARVDDGGIEVTVADQGPGIEEADRARLLQPFERGAHPRQDVTGKGLGLAIANTVATAHGGVLVLAPQSPQGLCAMLRLPGHFNTV
ncbi:PAS domain-containing sensor histidine kinase [Nocardioides pyridinolyticus]